MNYKYYLNFHSTRPYQIVLQAIDWFSLSLGSALTQTSKDKGPIPLTEDSILKSRKPTLFLKPNLISGIYIFFLGIVVLLLSTKGITDESTVSLQGDVPRYLMNGVYFHDLLRDLPLTRVIEYTYHYYARYPALSLGHHPLLLGVAEVPFYAVFGISVFSARLTIVFFTLLAGMVWFLLIRSIYGQNIAFLSSLLFLTTPYIVGFSRVVMPEILTLSLIIVSTYFFYQYCTLEKNRYVFAFAISFVLSVYAKHLAIFMAPIFLGYFLLTKGVKKLLKKEVILSGIIILVLLSPLVPLTLKFSQTNVNWVAQKDLTIRTRSSNILYHLKATWKYHVTLPVLITSLVSIGVSIYRKDPRGWFFLLWIVGFYLQITYLEVQEPRYTIYWIPAFCIFSAITINSFQDRLGKGLLSILFILIIGYQFTVAFQAEPEYAEGYEQAAKYVVENRKGESVLFSGNVDTGFFIFFVRKHDPYQDLIVLRADKILATSRINQIIEERITTREQIYGILQDFGVGYIVIEDKKFESPALEWLREEVKSDRFILRKKIPIYSNSYRLQGVALAIYEYKDYAPPKRNKIVNMNVPLMNSSISVQLDDLLHSHR